MPRQFSRNRRVADLVQRELALMIQLEMRDSHLGMITISAADVSPDLSSAKIYVTSLGGDYTMDELIEMLNAKSGHFRYELAKVMHLRSVPRLKFIFDRSIERGSRLSAMIDSLHDNTTTNKKSGQ
ncbi:MAG: 30S ribosome-binding factor RbfA [Gammaproteobacteria bacterium]